MKVLQTLDFEKNCTGIFYNHKVTINPDPSTYDKYLTNWKYSRFLRDHPERTYLYVLLRDERKVEDFSANPDLLLQLKKQIGFHKKAAISAKIQLDDACIFSIIPEHKLNKYFELRQHALEEANIALEKQKDYDILHKAHELTSIISTQDISYKNKKSRIFYNIFGSSTGRLTTEKGSLPILNLKKDQRKFITPQNDAFVELDLNAAEIRMLMALSGKDQPEGDIHEYLQKEISTSPSSRAEFKEKLFAWLYNPASTDIVFGEFFQRETFRDFFDSDTSTVNTPFGRALAVEERKAQNYLLQSTTSDQVLENAHEIQKLLKEKKSTIAFMLHDSIILDMSREDAIMLKEIKQKFETTRWGQFVSTCKIGADFGNLKEIKI
jgi:hypothetical protein